ncbi:MAG TPA: ThuA domain-containing protein [Gemmataceae bacterium]|nr:ThuA domain-containing protein [Gemmataceae bacterium]
MHRARVPAFFFVAAAILTTGASVRADDNPWVVYKGDGGPGSGKNIVFVSGDEEYRSEEGLPQLAKILSQHYGFTCTVLFAVDLKDGTINPNETHNIPGLEALKTADLMVIQTRYRDLPDDQMKYIVDYVESGKPVVGMRTATHAFNIPAGKTYTKYGANYGGKDYPGGFGKQVLGETWVNHWGQHGKESTGGLLVKGQEDHPILRGIKDRDIWGPTDVYEVHLPLRDSCTPLVLGAVLENMKPDDKPIEGTKNDPMMPVAWTNSYKGESGKTSRVFATTLGAATDMERDGTRRMIVNACFWALGMEDQIPAKGTNVELVGEYKPTPFGFGKYKKGVKPADLQMQ